MLGQALVGFGGRCPREMQQKQRPIGTETSTRRAVSSTWPSSWDVPDSTKGPSWSPRSSTPSCITSRQLPSTKRWRTSPPYSVATWGRERTLAVGTDRADLAGTRPLATLASRSDLSCSRPIQPPRALRALGHDVVVTKDEPHLLAELRAVTVRCEASIVLTGRATHVPLAPVTSGT